MKRFRSQTNGFALTKYAVFADGLNLRQKMVLIVISAHADNRGIAYPSLATIARVGCMGYKRDRIIAIIKELVEKGFLERKGFHGRNRQYWVIGPVHTAGTGQKEGRVPMAGTVTCAQSGYTNIQFNIPDIAIQGPLAVGDGPTTQDTKEERDRISVLAGELKAKHPAISRLITQKGLRAASIQGNGCEEAINRYLAEMCFEAEQSTEGVIRKIDKRIEGYSALVKRINGDTAEKMATEVAKLQMRRSEAEVRLKRIRRERSAWRN